MNSFQAFRFHGSILKGLQSCSIHSPTHEQKIILKAVAAHTDLVINADSGVSPEIGYLTGALSDAAAQNRRGGTKIVILTEDPERAEVLQKWVLVVAEDAKITSASLFGMEEQNEKSGITLVASGPTVLIAPPRLFASILESSNMTFREVSLLVVEKAEEIEHWEDVKAISDRVRSKCQRIFVAAKDSRVLRGAEATILTSPQLVKALPVPDEKKTELKTEAPPVPKDLTQYYINVPPRSKISVLLAFLKESDLKSNLIFTASGRTADRLFTILRKNDFRVVSLHKGIDEQTYQQRLELFASRKVQNLVVGDYSALELSSDGVEQVINYDVPEDVNEYKFRADLVGSGSASRILSLVSKQDRSDILTICNELGYAPEELPVPEAALARIQSGAAKRGQKQQKGGSGGAKGEGKHDAKGGSNGKGKGKGKGKTSHETRTTREPRKEGDSTKKNGQKRSRSGSKQTQRSARSSRPARSERSRANGRAKTNAKPQNTMDVGSLPQAKFDQLPGGRTGTKKTEKKGGLFSRIKKFFGG